VKHSEIILRNTTYSDDEVRKSAQLWAVLGAFTLSKSTHTTLNYEKHINRWLLFLKAERQTVEGAIKIMTAQVAHADAFKSYLLSLPAREVRKRGGGSRLPSTARSVNYLSPNSVRTILWALKSLYEYLLSHELVKRNIFHPHFIGEIREASQRREIKRLTAKEVKAILDACNESMGGIHDCAVLSVMFSTGLRRSEISNLRIGDVRLTEKGGMFLHIETQKGGRAGGKRALPKWARANLRAYLQVRLRETSDDRAFLFKGRQPGASREFANKPLTGDGLRRLIQHYAKLAAIKGHISPHSARATVVTRALDMGLSHREVRAITGHSSVLTVERYDKKRWTVEDSPGLSLDYESPKKVSRYRRVRSRGRGR